MTHNWERTRHPQWVVAPLVAYLLLAWFLPSHWHNLWLGAWVILAARTWEIRGGLIGAATANVALAAGLYRAYGAGLLAEEHLLTGYFWVMIATVALGYFVGHLTRAARRTAQVNLNLKQAKEQLSALHQIAVSLSTTLDDQRLMEMVLEQLNRLWGYDYTAILLHDESAGELVLSAVRGFDVELGLRVKLDESISGAAVHSRAAVCVGDVSRDPRYVAGLPDARSELAVPLLWEGRCLGVLNVESRSYDAYGPRDIMLLSTVAEQAAAYLANARLHQQACQMAITDAHTGLYNYRHYLDRVVQQINEAQLSGGHFSLLMLDLDHFKRVNDTYGHPTGDQVLAQTAELLRHSCRQVDLVFRYGGEEFAVILPDADKAAASRVAERIRERMAQYPFLTLQGRLLDFSLTASIGVASYPEDGLTQVDLILAADRALYTAKRTGRNQVVVATPGQTVAERESLY